MNMDMNFNIYDDQELNIAIRDDYDDDERQRNAFRSHTFQKEHMQKYEGQFLHNNLHGQGKYTWLTPDGNGYLIEDSYYTNKVHGYANIYYNNDGLFEGLFKSNKRYGPGIFTAENGKQDVGLWDGLALIRLSCTVCKKRMPKLATSEFGKIKLLRYRKLVPIDYGRKFNKCAEILNYLHAPQRLIDNSHLLCNEYVRHEESLLFDKELYEELFFGKEDCYIDVISYEDLANKTPNVTETDATACGTNSSSDRPDLDYLLANESICDCEECSPEEERPQTAEEWLNSNRNRLTEEHLTSGWQKCRWKTKRLCVTSILAWNNEPHLIDMLRYCFRFRKMETDRVSFNVQSLLAGLRHRFNAPGEYEDVCRQFLVNCHRDNHIEVLQFANDYHINPDLCDSTGNTGTMFAAASDSIKTLEILVSLGANVDSLNDEGLTPLTMSLLRYIAVLHDVVDWERAFVGGASVATTDNDEMRLIENWRPNFSLLDMISSNRQFAKSNEQQEEGDDEELKDEYLTDLTRELRTGGETGPATVAQANAEPGKLQNYLFDFDCVRMDLFPKRKKEKKAKPKGKPGKKEDKKKAKNAKAKTVDKVEEEEAPRELSEAEREKLRSLETIENTATTLLRFGADPNIGEVPFLPLILSIFTNNLRLMELIVKNKPRMNATTLNDNLTALHVLVSLKPPRQEHVDMLRLLLQNHANPNQRCADSHWHDEKLILLNVKPVAKDGKSAKKSSAADSVKPPLADNIHEHFGGPYLKCPLHIVAMRYDYGADVDCGYLHRMANLLVSHGGDVNAKYLGHTPLTLAMLRGNFKLMETLLANGANANARLDYDLGVPIAVLTLKRYENWLPTDVCASIFDALYEHHVNPLKEVADCGNAVEFMLREHEIVVEEVEGKKKGKKEKKQKTPRSKKGAVKSNMEEVKALVITTTRRVLEKHIRSKALMLLYLMLKENVTADEEADGEDVNKVLAKFLTADFCLKTFQLFVRAKEIVINDLDECNSAVSLLVTVLELIEEANASKQRGSFPQDFDELMASIDWRVTHAKKDFWKRAIELDKTETIYQVCYNCLTKKGKLLFPCPICDLVYFCSQKCNVASIKMKSNVHPCKAIFYNAEKAKYDNCVKNDIEQTSFRKLAKLKEILNEKNRVKEEGVELAKKPSQGIKLRDGDGRLDIKTKSLTIFKNSQRDIRNVNVSKHNQATQTTSNKIFKTKANQVATKAQKVLDEGQSNGNMAKSSDEHSVLSKSNAQTHSESTDRSKPHDKKFDGLNTNETIQGSPRFGNQIEVKPKKIDGSIINKETDRNKRNKGQNPVETNVWYVTETNRYNFLVAGDMGDWKLPEKSLNKSENKLGKPNSRGDWKNEDIETKSNGKSADWVSQQNEIKIESFGGKGDAKREERNRCNRNKQEFVKSWKNPGKIVRKSASYPSGSKKGTKGSDSAKLRATITDFDSSKQLLDKTNKSDTMDRSDLSKPSTAYNNNLTWNNDRALDRLPTRYQFIMNKLLQLFPDVDLSSLLLPYTCYKDGELYYRFIEDKYVCSTYSHI